MREANLSQALLNYPEDMRPMIKELYFLLLAMVFEQEIEGQKFRLN